MMLEINISLVFRHCDMVEQDSQTIANVLYSHLFTVFFFQKRYTACMIFFQLQIELYRPIEIQGVKLKEPTQVQGRTTSPFSPISSPTSVHFTQGNLPSNNKNHQLTSSCTVFSMILR